MKAENVPGTPTYKSYSIRYESVWHNNAQIVADEDTNKFYVALYSTVFLYDRTIRPMLPDLPSQMLRRFGVEVRGEDLRYEEEWERRWRYVSEAIDRMGTVQLRMFDRWGNRVDELLYPPEYWDMLYAGYRAGVVGRVFRENSLKPFYVLGYITSFYDPGVYCPYTVSISTALPLYKYGSKDLKERYLPNLIATEGEIWQGATWMTEAKGGSDLGNTVETIAEPSENGVWILNGEKYFASNVGAEVAVVAARIKGRPKGVRSLALFLLPKYRRDGSLNYLVRRIKPKIGTRSVPTGEVELRNSEAYLLGRPEWGIYLILEALNVSRVANSVGSVALAHRSWVEAMNFAKRRWAFGRYINDHPLLKRQFEDVAREVEEAFVLAWESVEALDGVYLEKPKYSKAYHTFRLIAHMSKYWTAEVSVKAAKWSMEVHGGMGVLEEYPAERLLREAMILPIWEGTAHRQVLDGVEAIVKKDAHVGLYERFKDYAGAEEIRRLGEEIKAMDDLRREREADLLFKGMIDATLKVLRERYSLT